MRFPKLCLSLLCLAACYLAGGTPVLAQVPDETSPSPSTTGGISPQVQTHRFWDRENAWLFAGIGAARALDYSSTLNMRRRGRQEILLTNWVVDHHALFAGIEGRRGGALGGSIVRTSPHRPPRTGTLGIHRAHRPSHRRRRAELQLADGPSGTFCRRPLKLGRSPPPASQGL